VAAVVAAVVAPAVAAVVAPVVAAVVAPVVAAVVAAAVAAVVAPVVAAVVAAAVEGAVVAAVVAAGCDVDVEVAGAPPQPARMNDARISRTREIRQREENMMSSFQFPNSVGCRYGVVQADGPTKGLVGQQNGYLQGCFRHITLWSTPNIFLLRARQRCS
jgi:hypothetical protein